MNAGTLRLTNAIVDVVVSIDAGPRVLRYAFVDGDNVFAQVPNLATPTPIGKWKPVGGHRLWVAPESMPGSYAPDLEPVAHEMITPLAASFRQKADAAGIEKAITVRLAPASSEVVVTHTITNRTYWPISVAPWAITIVASDGTAVIPQPPHRSHAEDLLPARAVVQWSFTDLTDPRWSIGPQLIRLTPDPSRAAAQKIGVSNEQGWCALVRGRTVFMKRFAWDRRATYPDFGCNNEVFTAGAYLEIETLGPQTVLHPGGSSTHIERWFLFRDVELGESEAEQHAALSVLLRETGDCT
jgi:hypothetical protein